MTKIQIKKSEFKKLFDIACNDWKSRFIEKFKDEFFDSSDTLTFSEDFILQMQKACTTEQKVVFDKIFKKHLPKEREWLTDIDKVYKALNKVRNTSLSDKTLAFEDIKTLEEYFNNGWKVDLKDRNQYKYYPYFEIKGSGGLVFSGSYFSSGYLGGFVGYFKSKEISDFIGKNYINIYRRLYI